MKTVSVRAISGGWIVECGPEAEPLAFLSGAAAERQAIRWSAVFAARGEAHRLVIHDRTGAVIASRLRLAPIAVS